MTIAPIKCERCEWHLKGAILREPGQLPATEDFIHYVIFKGSSIPLPPSMAGFGEGDFDEGPLDLHLAALTRGAKTKKKVKLGLSSMKPGHLKVSGRVKNVGKSLLQARKSKQLIRPSSAQKRVRKLLKACVARASRKAYPTRNVGRGRCLSGGKSLKDESSKTLSLAVRRLPATSFLKHHRKNLQNRTNRTRKCRKALDYSEDTEEMDANIRPMTESTSAKLLESPDRSLREIRDEISAAARAKSKFSPSSDEDLPLSTWAAGSSTSRNLLRTPPRSGNSRKVVQKCDLKCLAIIPRRKKKIDSKKVVPVPIELPDLKISVEAVKVADERGVGFELKNPPVGSVVGGGRRTRSVSWKRSMSKTTSALELGLAHENLQRCRKQLFPPLPSNQKRQRDRIKKLTNHRRASLVSCKPNKLTSPKESCNKTNDEIAKKDLGKESVKRSSTSEGSRRKKKTAIDTKPKYSSKYKPNIRRNAPTKRRSSLKLLTDSSVLKLGDVPTRSSRQPNRYQRLNDRRTNGASRLASNLRSRDASQANRNVLLRERSVRLVNAPLRSSSRLVKRPKWLDSADVICEDGEISD